MDTSAVKSDSAINSSPNQDVSTVAKGRVENEKAVDQDHQDTKTKIKVKDIGDKERGSYNCSHCGVPKKGHVCPYQPKTKSKKRKKKKPPKRTHQDLIHIQHRTNNISNSKKVGGKRVLSGGDTDATMKKKAGAQKRPRTSKLPSTTESHKSVKDFLSKAVSSVVDTVTSEICYCSSMFENTENKRRRVNLDSNAASNSSRRSTTPLDVPPPRQSQLDSQDMKRHGNNGESSTTVAQLYNSSTMVGAVRRFVNDVYCPFLLSAQKRMGNTSPNVYRIQLSTLLAIREMMLMNADKLFTFSTLDQSSSKYSSERKYLSFVFANAIVKNAARRLPSRDRDQDQVYSDFLQATRRYDSKSEDFQFALTRTDVLEVSEHKNGIQVGEQERSLHKIGFNCARSRHPLLATTETEGVGDGRMYGSTCPEPTACAAIYIETSTTVDTEDAATLESFKRMLRKPPPSKRRSSECIDLT